MMLFRNVRKKDLDAVFELAKLSGIGITTLPKEKKLLKERIELSCASFQKEIQEPGNEYYLFVLEDPKNKSIVGTAAIQAKTGHETPFYSYKVSKRTRVCHSLNIRSEYQVLSLVNDNQGRTEICTLFLTPDYRKNHNGLLLSKARFLFMAQHPSRFNPLVIAELRGLADKNGKAPFWDNVGSHFFHMTFEEADRLTLATNKQFIADLMPRNPIYLKLLSEEAQEAIGKPHQSSLPAMNILLKEGFRYNDYVDIFDAGPTIESPLSDIKTIKNSRLMRIQGLSDEVSSRDYLIARAGKDFCATISHSLLNQEDNTCIISKETAKILGVQCGDTLCIAPLL